MKIAIIAEKNSAFRNALAAIPAHLGATEDVVGLLTLPYGNLAPRFAYPRGLRIADYPLTRDTAYRPIDMRGDSVKWRIARKPGDGRWTDAPKIEDLPDLVQDAPGRPWRREDLAQHFRDADRIIVFGGHETDSLVAAMALDQMLPLGSADPRVTALKITAEDPATIRQAIADSGSLDQICRDQMKAMRIKQRFDYNYRMNANVILRTIQQDQGLPSDVPPLSKYALQLLYHLRSVPGPHTEGRIIHGMSKWTGTGRYPAEGVGYRSKQPYGWRVSLGSPASRDDVLTSLRRAGLVEDKGVHPFEEIERDYPQSRIGPVRQTAKTVMHRSCGISQDGLRLLDALHPDCEDADLPFRIDAWQSMSETEAGEKVDRYIKTFFGKMKRFAENARSAA